MSEPARPEPILSVPDLIAALGGPDAAADVLAENVTNVRQWKHRGWITPDRFLKHSTILTSRQIAVSPAIWRQAEPVPGAAA